MLDVAFPKQLNCNLLAACLLTCKRADMATICSAAPAPSLPVTKKLAKLHLTSKHQLWLQAIRRGDILSAAASAACNCCCNSSSHSSTKLRYLKLSLPWRRVTSSRLKQLNNPKALSIVLLCTRKAADDSREIRAWCTYCNCCFKLVVGVG